MNKQVGRLIYSERTVPILFFQKSGTTILVGVPVMRIITLFLLDHIHGPLQMLGSTPDCEAIRGSRCHVSHSFSARTFDEGLVKQLQLWVSHR